MQDLRDFVKRDRYFGTSWEFNIRGYMESGLRSLDKGDEQKQPISCQDPL